MGFHPLDMVVILVIGLLIFGPKAIQSVARNAGKTVGQAKEAKDKLLAELPMEELNSVRDNISRIPLSPQQAALMLLTPEQQREKEKQETAKAPEAAETPPEEKQSTQVHESSSPANS
ncbi:MAG TPA: twin-arginine translocase TatA/TatE family subunit [Ktedonobacteraceae bacterium]|nr:twin-arginine translocase TatA/TatE family subunit [Ktedonobacteraceae bacterium]